MADIIKRYAPAPEDLKDGLLKASASAAVWEMCSNPGLSTSRRHIEIALQRAQEVRFNETHGG